MTNHLFELAGNRKTETVTPRAKKNGTRANHCFSYHIDSYCSGMSVKN